ncbi:MAG: hypothetical protein IJ512_04735 [Ruminococcus sp.]|nr:hypothetical protein [Ruminococcus sp.]
MAKNYLPFEDENWNQIVEDAFAPDAEVHVFSARYQRKKMRLMNQNTQKKPVLRRKGLIVAAACIATAIVIPTTAFAGSRIYNAFVEQPAEYQRDITIELGESAETSQTDDGAVVVDSGTYKMSVGYVPDDLKFDHAEENADGNVCGFKYGNWGTDDWRSATFSLFVIDNETRTFNETLKNVTAESTYETDDRIVFISRLNKDFDKRAEIWVAFKDTKYVAKILALQEFTEDELKMMAEGLVLEKSDVECASSYTTYTEYQEWLQAELEAAASTDEPEFYKEHMGEMNLISVGETFSDFDVDVTLDSITFQDTFDGITTDGIGREYDYSKYMNADGTLADNIRTWYTKGDGVNTIDEVSETETMSARIMVVNLTYENKGTEEIEYCICPGLRTIDENGDWLIENTSIDGRYAIDSLSDLTVDRLGFSFSTDHENSKNNLAAFKPGEKAQVQLAFIVYDEPAADYYLCLDTYQNVFVDMSSLTE